MGEAKRIRDYPQMARAAAARDLFADLIRIGPADFIPHGDDGGADTSRISDRTAVFLTIGARGDLTESMAKAAAGAFLKIKKRAGAGMVILSLSGWNDDPREIWDIPEAAEYVRLWGRLVGFNESMSPIMLARALIPLDCNAVTLLAACGCFGAPGRRSVQYEVPFFANSLGFGGVDDDGR